MILFLTSSPTGDLDGKFRVDGIDYRNGFCEELRKYWKENSRCLIASATPSNRGSNEEFAHFLYEAFLKSGMSCQCVDILDDLRRDIATEEIHSYDLIVLGGGHVPTQNRFFTEINLRDKLQGFEGIVMGISAGSMNAAEIVYAQPEEAREAVDPDYQRFLKGLGLTSLNILPHYQMVKDYWIDGLRLFEDITYPDSAGREFIAIPDGSYLLILGDEVYIRGEAYKITPEGLSSVWA